MLTDESNNRIELGKQIGSTGGEGSVYEVVGRSNLVVKKYHKPPSANKTEKLRALISLIDNELRKIAAWPLQIVTENKMPAGFLMEKTTGRQIHNLYRPVDRRQYFPNASWQQLITVAKNVAAAFQIIHQRGILMADINESNLLITPHGEVRFIDCDSFQITYNGKSFPCEVGVGMWTPPELQGKSFGNIIRDFNHDRFGLAAMIFHILFMGRHPFAGVPKSQHLLENPPSVEDCIKRRQFAYSQRATTESKAPPFSLSLKSLPSNLADLFEKAFLTDVRPTATEWHAELLALDYQKCQWGHIYYRRLTNCPWCDIWNDGGPNFFISINTIDTSGTSITEIERLLVEIEHLNVYHLGNASLQVSSLAYITSTRLPLEKLRIEITQGQPFPKFHKTNPKHYIGFGLITISFVFLCLAPKAIIIWIAICSYGIHLALREKSNPAISIEIDKRKTKAESTYKLVAAFYNNLLTKDIESGKEFDALKTELSKDIQNKQKELTDTFDKEKSTIRSKANILLQEYKTIPSKRENMRSERREKTQKEEYLKIHRIRGAHIPQIGPARMAILSQYGIGTAWDVKSMGSIPSLGQGNHELKIWVSQLEARFKYRPELPLSTSAEQDIARDILKLEKNILDRFRDLKRQWNTFKTEADPERLQQKVAKQVSKHREKLNQLQAKINRERLSHQNQLNQLLAEFSEAKASLDLCPPPAT